MLGYRIDCSFGIYYRSRRALSGFSVAVAPHVNITSDRMRRPKSNVKLSRVNSALPRRASESCSVMTISESFFMITTETFC